MHAIHKHTGIVQLLLDKGADAYAETSDGDSVLATAVGGVPDIDKFTVGKCQTATVQALFKKAPELKLKDNFYGRAGRMAARIAGCTDVLDLIERARLERNRLRPGSTDHHSGNTTKPTSLSRP
jgi:hypothetical protein